MLQTLRESISTGKGLAFSTVHGVKGTLSAVLNFGVRKGIIAKNPLKEVTLPVGEKPEIRCLTDDEVNKLIAVKNQFWYGDAITLMIYTGLRPSELFALIWDDIDFELGILSVRRACKWINDSFTGYGPPKSRRGYRKIELAPEQVDLLRAIKAKQDRHIRERLAAGLPYGEPKMRSWIKAKFKTTYKHMDTNLIFCKIDGGTPNGHAGRKNFKSMLRRSGITGKGASARLYDIRHTHASRLLTMGYPPHEVAERMGHTVNRLLETYSHVMDDRRREASIALAKLYPLPADCG